MSLAGSCLSSESAPRTASRRARATGIVPKASRVSVLYNPADRSNVLVLKELQEAAPALGLMLQPLEVREPAAFEGAFAMMTRERATRCSGPLVFQPTISIRN
jgi:ABC-type uncharacterized transport system substrate-binding protein